MNRILARGALLVLPLFFCVYLTAAARPPADLYRVFYLPLSEASLWMAKEKGDMAKDLFLARHRLPLKGRGTVTTVPINVTKSYAGGQEYFHLYVDIAQKSSFIWSVGGVAKGTMTINGEQKGTIVLAGPADHARIEVTFAPGAYVILFTIEKRQEGMPMTFLSDKPLVFSTRGFTRAFASSVKVSARIVPEGEFMARLYRTSCIPVSQDDQNGRSTWQAAFGAPATEFVYGEKQPLIVLLRNAGNEKARAALLKFGFDDTSLAWWIEWFKSGRICTDEV